MKFFKFTLILFAFTALRAISIGQELKLMSYNMLNFPTGNIQGRVDTLEKIVSYIQPDLLMIQELKTAQGLSDATAMMNELGFGNFSSSQFVAQQSSPGDDYPLHHAIVFNEEKIHLKSQNEIITAVRDINEFVMYLHDDGLAIGSDTTFIYVYVTHLKSSEGADNVALRLSMVNDWIEHINEHLTGDENVIIAGDFNLYSNTEDAYEALMNEENTVVMRDPFEAFGNWTGSGFAHKEILTQSTRVNQVAGDGAGGGLDDRFDFILFSEAMMNDANEVHYITDSFVSLGNNGNCYNQNITDCIVGNDVPSEVIQAMYYMSDHIPQVCSLELNLDLAVPQTSLSSINIDVIQNTSGLFANVTTTKSTGALCSIYNIHGQLITASAATFHKGTNVLNISDATLRDGCYIIHIGTEDGQATSEHFVHIK